MRQLRDEVKVKVTLMKQSQVQLAPKGQVHLSTLDEHVIEQESLDNPRKDHIIPHNNPAGKSESPEQAHEALQGRHLGKQAAQTCESEVQTLELSSFGATSEDRNPDVPKTELSISGFQPCKEHIRPPRAKTCVFLSRGPINICSNTYRQESNNGSEDPKIPENTGVPSKNTHPKSNKAIIYSEEPQRSLEESQEGYGTSEKYLENTTVPQTDTTLPKNKQCDGSRTVLYFEESHGCSKTPHDSYTESNETFKDQSALEDTKETKSNENKLSRSPVIISKEPQECSKILHYQGGQPDDRSTAFRKGKQYMGSRSCTYFEESPGTVKEPHKNYGELHESFPTVNDTVKMCQNTVCEKLRSSDETSAEQQTNSTIPYGHYEQPGDSYDDDTKVKPSKTLPKNKYHVTSRSCTNVEESHGNGNASHENYIRAIESFKDSTMSENTISHEIYQVPQKV